LIYISLGGIVVVGLVALIVRWAFRKANSDKEFEAKLERFIDFLVRIHPSEKMVHFVVIALLIGFFIFGIFFSESYYDTP
jgi:TRAP-type C4-dicarboxylate transport system permease large subunit